LIEGQENLKRYITDFYKKLFGNPGLNNIRFSDTDMEKLNDEDKEVLLKEFTMQELKMAANKAAGLDGFNAEFYQKNWELVKQDLFGLLKDFQKGKLDIARLNYGVITLVSKGKDVDRI
jgi:hypothetical protein